MVRPRPGARRRQRSARPAHRAEAAQHAPVTPRASGPGVARVDLRIVDRTRTTAAVGEAPALACRVLPLEVRYPTAATTPLPLVVVAHGLDGNPGTLGPLLDAWSAAGYVVAAPTFPVTRKDADGRSLPTENVDQAADVRLTIDRLLEPAPADPAATVRPRIDASEIGVAGMSLGGQTVYGLIANTCCEDHRVRAAIVMAGVHREYPGGRYERNPMPVLLVQGDADAGYHNSVDAYDDLVPPKWFVTLRGSRHSPPFETPLGPEAPLVRTVTTQFWDRYLKHRSTAADAISAAVHDAGDRARLQRALG